jgi:sugar phosphate permease
MLAEALAARLAARGVHYGWVMVAITFLVLISTAAVMGLPGVLIGPLEAEFGWSAGEISGPLGLRLFFYGLVAPFTAAMLMRFGIMRVVAAAMLVIGLGFASTVVMRDLFQLWLSWGVLVGIGTGLTALVLGAQVASRWFTARRGLVVGLLTAANATGQMLFLPLNAWMATEFGWRMALLPPLALAVLGFVAVLLLARDYPAQLGLAPYGERAIVPVPRRQPGSIFATSLNALGMAARTRVFWVLAFTFFVCGLSTNGVVQSHFIPLCMDYGVAPVMAASFMAVIGACDFLGTIISGWLSDRFDSRKLLFWYYGLRGVSLVLLPFSDFTLVGLSLFSVFYGLDWVATVPPTVRLAGQHFGREAAPVVFGWVFMAHMLGGGVAAALTGLVRDGTGSYLPAYFAAGLACFLAAVAVFAIARTRPALAA